MSKGSTSTSSTPRTATMSASSTRASPTTPPRRSTSRGSILRRPPLSRCCLHSAFDSVSERLRATPAPPFLGRRRWRTRPGLVTRSPSSSAAECRCDDHALAIGSLVVGLPGSDDEEVSGRPLDRIRTPNDVGGALPLLCGQRRRAAQPRERKTATSHRGGGA